MSPDEARRVDNYFTGVVEDELLTLLNSCTSIDIAVGYATTTGVERLSASIKAMLGRGGILRVVLGMLIPAGVTEDDLAAISELNSWDGNLKDRRVRVTVNLYHGKLYLCRGENWLAALSGSSNLTGGGLRDNIELNRLVSGAPTTPELLSLSEFFEELWNEKNSLPLHAVQFKVRDKIPELRTKASSRAKVIDEAGDVAVDGIQAPVEVLLTRANLWAYGARPGRSGREAYLNIRAVHAYFPPKGTVFDVVTDIPGVQFKAKVSGGGYAGDPIPKNLESAGDLEPLFAWLVDEHGAQPGDVVSITKLEEGKYYFRF